MLDDANLIKQRDPQDALGVAADEWQQLSHDFGSISVPSGCNNIVFSGMGGSALAALMAQSWPGYQIPFEVTRQYHIPSYVSDKTLFIASSYSGNTEETLSTLEEAEAKGTKVVVLAGGGKLIDIAKAKNYPHIVLPQVGQPRFATFYSFRALVTVLEAAGFAPVGSLQELASTAEFLKAQMTEWLPNIPTAQNPTKKLATEVMGRSIVIYSGPLLVPAAYKWKISLNENSKNLAWFNQYPEWNHNELSGWLGQPVQKPYSVIELASNLEHPRVQKRFEVIGRLASGKRPAPLTVNVQGSSILEQLVWAIAYGDFVSLYLAITNGINPTPVELQEKLKQVLND